jgi:hypothetical protein
VGTPDGHHTAGLDPLATRTALQSLVAELVTVDRLNAALRTLPLEAAMRAVIDAAVEGARDRTSWSAHWVSCRPARRHSRLSAP